MKKYLLLAACFLTLCNLISAKTMEVGVAGDNIVGVGTNEASTNYVAAVEIPQAVARTMKGSKITGVSLGFDNGAYRMVNVFVRKDLAGDDIVSQSSKISTTQYNDIALTEPYIIDGDRFYIGYTYRQSVSTGKPIGFDGSGCSNSCFDLLANYKSGQEVNFTHRGQESGSLCFRFTVEGDNLPAAAAVPFDIELPVSIMAGDQFSYKVNFKNMGTEPITSVDVVTTLGSAQAQTFTKQLATPLQPGQTTTVQFSGQSFENNLKLPVSAYISKVNGIDNVWAEAVSTSAFANSGAVSQRMLVLEENTGTDCGFCPRGIVGLETVKEKHPDRVINIAVHNYNGRDPMHCTSYDAWHSLYATQAPWCVANRDHTFDPTPGACESAFVKFDEVVAASIKITAWYSDSSESQVETLTQTVFGTDDDAANYALAWVITEDNVGPYYQNNNYSGGSLGAMGGFENKESYTPVVYNDVARDIFHWNGLSNSVPRQLRADEVNSYSFTMPIKSDKEWKHKDLNYIALLINRNNKTIVTGAICKIGERPNVSAATVNSDQVSVVPVAGGIEVIGNPTLCNVYTLDGRLQASARNAGFVALPAGIYVVRTAVGNEAHTAKVCIR